jgi:flagellar biogenesis protein FliO
MPHEAGRPVNAGADLEMLLRVGGSLVAVVALALLAARLARRAGVRGPGAGLRVVDRVGLTREGAVTVVEVAGRVLVLGVTAASVSLLTELPSGSLPARPDDAVPADRGGAVDNETARGATGSALDPRTWRQGVEALRDLTVRR